MSASVGACHSRARPVATPAEIPQDVTTDASVTDSTPAPPRALRATSELPDRDRVAITACGRLDRLGIGPRDSPPNFFIWGVKFEGEREFAFFLRPPPWPNADEGAARSDLRWWPDAPSSVCVSGTFYREFPLHPGDPPHTSRLSGRWLFDVTVEPARP